METNPNNIEDQNPPTEDVKQKFTGLLWSLKVFFGGLLDIRHNTDRDTTVQSIKEDIPFKGHNSWILICSIFIASAGLNANSTAVVIGAMLISPLMGPILGIGLSIAINDIDTLRRSLKNFGVMVGLSILTAYLFFTFFSLHEASSELLARVAPDIRDVLIAFFGGLALVIARAKKGTIATVIYGVAIATALMPPLCTIGYGLAEWNLKYVGGALYLFTINTIFIALATFIVLKLLRFPMVKYANSKKRRRISQIASAVAIIAMIPASYAFYNVFQESRFKNQAREFIQERIATYQFSKGGLFLDDLTEMVYEDDDNSSIELVFMGDEVIPENIIETWKTQKQDYSKLENTELLVVQGGKDDSEEKFTYISELYEAKKQELVSKDERIRVLEQELAKLSKLTANQVPFEEIGKEAKINYEGLEELGFSNIIKTNFKRIDTIPTFSVKWTDSLSLDKLSQNQEKLKKWLQLKLKSEKIQVKTME